jgi:hypothetical protein
MVKKAVFFALLFLLVSTIIFAEGENLTLKIAVIGAGDELYFWWGHIALIIEDSDTNQSNFYDYGLFSFENENFYYNFIMGRLLYSCGVSPSWWNIEKYIETNRDVVIYTLDLPPEKRLEVKKFAEVNVLPENRDYYYHHFRDNCSTRIRDIVDLITDGQFYEQYGKAPGRYTLRQHVRRHTYFSPAGDWILNFVMGQGIDTEITIWDEMFLPSEVGKRIDDFWYTDSNGVKRKLVSYVETVNKAEDRPLVLDIPRKQWPRELAFSLALSAIFGFFFFLQYKKIRTGTILAGISISLCSLFFGIAGLIIYFMGIFTNHDYSYNNINMIFCTPLLLAAVPYGLCYALTQNQDRRIKYDMIIRITWLLTVIGIIVSMLIKLLPWFWQKNLTDQMLMLPIALVFTLQPVGLREARQRLFKCKIFSRKKA